MPDAQRAAAKRAAVKPSGARKTAGAKKAPPRKVLAAKKTATATLRATGATAAKTPRKRIPRTGERFANRRAANLATAAQAAPGTAG